MRIQLPASNNTINLIFGAKRDELFFRKSQKDPDLGLSASEQVHAKDQIAGDLASQAEGELNEGSKRKAGELYKKAEDAKTEFSDMRNQIRKSKGRPTI